MVIYLEILKNKTLILRSLIIIFKKFKIHVKLEILILAKFKTQDSIFRMKMIILQIFNIIKIIIEFFHQKIRDF
jgi:hypothetical protein